MSRTIEFKEFCNSHDSCNQCRFNHTTSREECERLYFRNKNSNFSKINEKLDKIIFLLEKIAEKENIL